MDDDDVDTGAVDTVGVVVVVDGGGGGDTGTAHALRCCCWCQ